MEENGNHRTFGEFANSGATLNILFMNTVGMTVLINTLKEASYYFTGSGAKGRSFGQTFQHKCKESLTFIQGTGLEIMVHRYHIALDPELLRKTFFTRFNRRDLIEP
jgi:hypothetical protein